MVSKWVISPIYPIYRQVRTHLLTIYYLPGTSKCDTIDGRNPAHHLEIYTTLNGINYYYYLSTGATFLPSTVGGIRIPRIQDPLQIYIYNHDSRSPTFYLAHGDFQVVLAEGFVP